MPISATDPTTTATSLKLIGDLLPYRKEPYPDGVGPNSAWHADIGPNRRGTRGDVIPYVP